MSSFINVTSPASHFLPFSASDKVPPLLFECPAPPYAYATQSHGMLNIGPMSGFSFPPYALQGVNATFAYYHLSATDSIYTCWTV
jgi:hypothetical protein